MKKSVKLILYASLLSISIYSVANTSSDFIKKISSQFTTQWATARQEKVYLHTDKPYYSAGENIWFNGYLVNATTHLQKSLSQFLYVELINKDSQVISRVKIKRDSLVFPGHLKLKPELPAGNYILRAYTYWMQNAGTDFFFTKNIYIGNEIDNKIKTDDSASDLNKKSTLNDQEIDVQFFPESGNILSGQLQQIAFKAIGRDGLSVDVSGKIITEKGDEITEFTSTNKGMGKFALQPDSGVTYYAMVKSGSGSEKRFKVPEVKTMGVGLQILFRKGKLWYEVFNHTPLTENAFFLLVHSRGRMLAALPLKEMNGQITESLLPPGIVSMSVIDTLGNTYCERLCFVRPTGLPKMSVVSNKPVYGKRESVELNLNILSSDGKPCAGNYSMSVTDSKIVKQDSTQAYILSTLLLTSDLKGYIEDPGSYFTDSINIDRQKLDLLMLTQGWRRFNTSDVVKGLYKQNRYYMEAGQTLSGRVVTVTKKPVKDCRVTAESSSLEKMSATKTDAQGRFIIAGFDFPDSTSFTLTAKRAQIIPDIEIIADTDSFPSSKVTIPFRPMLNQSMDDYFVQSKQKYFLDGKTRLINLDAVTVKGVKKENNKNKSVYSQMADYSISEEKLSDMAGMNIFNILGTMPGVQVFGEDVSIRGSKGNPLFMIDDIEMRDKSDLNFYTGDQIERIGIIKNANTAMFGPQGGNGVVCIYLKKNIKGGSKELTSVTKITAFGYQKPEQFYVPKYNVESVRNDKKPDLRSTIYWAPTLQTDSTGTTKVRFYTADKANDYNIVIEGITDNGEICRQVVTLKRNGE